MSEIKYIELGRPKGAKKNWVLEILRKVGIAHHELGGVIEVDEDRLIEALRETLLKPIGEIQVETKRPILLVNDLYDDHDMFRNTFRDMFITPGGGTGRGFNYPLHNEIVFGVQGVQPPPPYVPKLLDEIELKAFKPRPNLDDLFSELKPVGNIVPVTPIVVKALPCNVEKLHFHDYGPVEVVMYDVESSNISQIGCYDPHPDDANRDEIVLLVRFKGGALYRYDEIVSQDTFDFLFGQALARLNGEEKASVGSNFHRLVKVPANSNEIRCMKLMEDGSWKLVVPKPPKSKTE